MEEKPKSKEELIEWLKQEGYYNIKEIPEQGLCGLREFIFTIGLCTNLTHWDYGGRYCYPKDVILESVVAIETWDGKKDPAGSWIKYKGKGGERHNLNLTNKKDETNN